MKKTFYVAECLQKLYNDSYSNDVHLSISNKQTLEDLADVILDAIKTEKNEEVDFLCACDKYILRVQATAEKKEHLMSLSIVGMQYNMPNIYIFAQETICTITEDVNNLLAMYNSKKAQKTKRVATEEETTNE